MGTRPRYALILLVCCALLTSCAQFSRLNQKLINWGEEDWRVEALEKFTPQLKLAEVWSQRSGSDKEGQLNRDLFLAGKYLFSCDVEGNIYAFSAAQGKLLWKNDLKKDLSFCVGGGKRLALFGSVRGEVIAVSLKDGKEVWRKPFAGGAIVAISRTHRGAVLVRSQNGNIRLLDTRQGKERWLIKEKIPSLTIQGMSVPVFYQDQGLIGLDDGRLLMVSLEDGKVQQELRVGLSEQDEGLGRIVDIDGAVPVHDAVVYVSSYQGRTMALDLVRQKVVWVLDISSHRGPSVGNKNIYIANGNNELLALDKFVGTEIWRNSAFSLRDVSSPISYDQWVVLGDNEGNIFWVSKETGDILARKDIGDVIRTAPVRYKDQVIVIDEDGDLVALKVVARYRIKKG